MRPVVYDDVVDAAVAVLSIRRGADVVSDDAEDIQRLLSASPDVPQHAVRQR